MTRKFFNSFLILTAIGAAALLMYVAGCGKICCTIGFELALDSVYSLTDSSARCHVTISSFDEDTIKARGLCWSSRKSPTIDDDTTINGFGAGAFTGSMHGLTGSMTYWVRAYLINKKGVAYSDEVSFKTSAAPVFTLGENYGGGIIFYIDTTGVHGLIAAQADAGNDAEWGCTGTSIPNVQSSAFGTGRNNTDTITWYCITPGIAASICHLFASVYDTGWFLPSRDELDTLYVRRNIVGVFKNALYWSSTQSGPDSAWVKNFHDGSQGKSKKDVKINVRPVRAF